jgi:hypothetical protein
MPLTEMPLIELMNYFNDQLQVQTKLHSLPKNGFFKLTNSFGARFGNLLISTQFKTIIYRNEYLYGFYGDLAIRSATGNQLNIDDVFKSLDSKEQVIHLDRLSRTLLSMNFLQQHDQRQVKLFLPVHPRHIASITEDHGKTFELILADCGLGPNRVSLYTSLSVETDLTNFRNALGSYKERGYSIGIEIQHQEEIDKLGVLNIAPDYLITGKKFINALAIEKKQKPFLKNTGTIYRESQGASHFYGDADLHIISNENGDEKFLNATG